MHSLQHRCQQPTAELLLGGRFRYIDNGSNVLAVAHCDSVDCGLTRYKQRGTIAYSTSLDDRLGVHVILDVLPTLGILPDVLLTDDEEIGRSTAQEFIPHKQYNWMFQFDRRGQDAVHYEYNAMAPHIRSHFTLGQGSFSDICWLEHLGCGGLNIGTGYYNEHTRNSYANLEHTAAQVMRFQNFWNALHDTHVPYTPYIPPVQSKRKDYSALEDSLEFSEYDRWARMMGYKDVEEMVEQEYLPGRAAALDLIDDYIFGAQGFSKDWSKRDEEVDRAEWAEYANFDDRLF
jgi:hypothetical protein